MSDITKIIVQQENDNQINPEINSNMPINNVNKYVELNDPFVSVIAELELKRDRESATSIRREIENAQKKEVNYLLF